jgi:hypothetical protein
MYGGGFPAQGMKVAGGDENLPRLQQLSVSITTARYLGMMVLNSTEVHWPIYSLPHTILLGIHQASPHFYPSTQK